MNAYRDMVVQWSKDLGRTIDYLETRPDFDASKVGFYGISAGATAALPIVAVEPRLKAVVLLSGGLQTTRRPAETDPINFAPRITAPTLMLNGRDDFIFPLDDVARPLFALLGAPPDPAVPLATTVHRLQLIDGFPVEAHDTPLSLIATPEELIEVKRRRRAPSGIDWQRLPREALEEMPVLAELKRRRRR